MNETITVKFWGVRGSYPTPGIRTAGFGGNTACVEIRIHPQTQAAPFTIILDAGTGIIGLGNDLIKRSQKSRTPVLATLLFSHMHHDHTQGFPFFTPAYLSQTQLYLYAHTSLGHSLEDILNQTMFPPTFPLTLGDLQSTKNIHSLSEKEIILLDENGAPSTQLASLALPEDVPVIRCMRSPAHPGSVTIHRIEYAGTSVVYATDTEGYANLDQRLVAFARNTDLLIHDAQYTDDHYQGKRPGLPATQGYGHSTVTMACDVARAAGAKQLALIHFDPGYDDATLQEMESTAKSQFPAVIAAREGLEIEVSHPDDQTSRRAVPNLHSPAEKTGLNLTTI